MATKAACRAVTTAMAIAGRGARACDVCAGKSARWYCGADTAYLCDRCDTQVHSANSLSLRHERVRLTPSGAPAAARKPTADSSPPPRKRSISKILHTPVPQVLPSRKRSRTTRPHPHHRHQHQHQPQQEHQELQLFKALNPEPKQSVPKQSTETEELHELLTFDDLFDTEDFLNVDDDTHEVPSFITVSPQSSPSSTELGSTEQLESSSFDSFDAFSPDFHAVSSPSEDSNFAAYFKGKAALDDDVMSDHFLVPENGLDAEGDPLACDAVVDVGVDVDGGITLTGEACFIPGEIPDLDGFEEFGSRELGSLRFDLDPSPDDTGSESSPSNVADLESDRFASGPFAKFFASRPKPEPTTNAHPLSPESIKSEAKEILRCCREGLSEEDLRAVPSLQLNYDDVITAWSDRGEPWVHPDGLVPDMGNGDDDPSAGGREARVLRYKEKRRSRLFSKTIRYEVRKLNAERRPRMKGRFVKRTSNS